MYVGVRGRIKHMARWNSTSVKILGMVEIILGIMLLFPALIAVIYGEDPIFFLYPVPILLVMGTFQFVFFRTGEVASSARGILLMTVAWLMAFAVSAAPFYLFGFSFVDSLFEGVSGFTTTGASIVTDIESLPFSLLYWRSFIQWIGGIAVVIIFIFLLPMMGIGGRSFLNNELSGSGSARFSMRMKDAAKSFIIIYLMLTAAELILLMLCGVGVFEALCMTMSTISTGGMMVKGNSLIDYSMLVQAVVLFFMFMGGTNFYLHYRALYKRDIKAYGKSQEFIWTIVWFFVCALIIAAVVVTGLKGLDGVSTSAFADSVWEALFTVVSIGTSTGFGITDHTVWPMAALLILMVVGLFGAMSGSTSGGIKMYRIILVGASIKNGVYRMLHPNAIKDTRLDGFSVERDAASSASVVLLLFLTTGAVSVVFLAFSEPGLDFMSSLGLTVASLANCGMGLGDFGPLGTFAGLSDATKLFLSFTMWAGRIEIVMALILFTRMFWSDIFRSRGNGPEGDERIGSRIRGFARNGK